MMKKQMKGKTTRAKSNMDMVRIAKCANCGKSYEQSDYSILCDAITKYKPVCSLACNKAIGQVR